MAELLERLQSALVDRYRLDREVGAGGMATVFLAQDVRHDRRVALKILRPELAAVIGAERFLAEIKLTANLQHPHILPLFDSGEADGFLFYVMPFVEGESLRGRLTREKQLPVGEAVRIATEVASALDYAHRHGVIHRDIKPENILLHDGRALVADFGIALAASKASNTRMTETGMSLGTPHYMSPEQAMGEREITPRADVYALGAVLYEMLTGEPPFDGATAQAVVARVLTESPRPLLPQRHTIPPHVEAAVLTALEKLPADRFASAAELATALTQPGSARAAATVPMAARRGARSRLRSRLTDPITLGLTGLAIAGLAWAAVERSRPREPAAPTVRFLYAGSDSAPIVDIPPWPAAISPDGTQLVYATGEEGRSSTLFLRRSDQLTGHPIPGTANGFQPLFSPDGGWIAFESDGMEKKVRLDGSAPVNIARGDAQNGADWTINDDLVVGATGKAHGLSRVSVSGGELTPFTSPDSAHHEYDHLWPIASPDGHTVVFTIWSETLEQATLGSVSIDGGPVTRLGLKGVRPLAFADGALVYVQADGAVMAVRLDSKFQKPKGRPVPVLDPVDVRPNLNGNSGIFVSRGGALVTALPVVQSQLMWIGRDGVARPASGQPRGYQEPRLSPDGGRIAVLITEGGRRDVWIYDLDTGTLSRLTDHGRVAAATWASDGSKILYSAPAPDAPGAIWAQSVGSAAGPELLVKLREIVPNISVSPDGRAVVLQSYRDNTWDIVTVTLDSAHQVRPFYTSPRTEVAPRFSPDGRWVVLGSDESGAMEVYVRSFPEPNVKLQISVGGGDGALWAADGRSIYYRSGTAIMQARLATAPGLRVVSRDTAFRRSGSAAAYGNFDVSRDGTRLLVPGSESESYRLVVVPTWRTELRERLRAADRGR